MSGVESIGKNYAFVIWEELMGWFQTQVFSRYGFIKNCLGEKFVDSFQQNELIEFGLDREHPSKRQS